MKGGYKLVEEKELQNDEDNNSNQNIDDEVKNEDIKSVEEEKDGKPEENLQELLKAKETEAKDYLDKLQRSVAEFDNFRKRTIKEKASMYENGSKDVLEKILPVIDNFERAFLSVDDEIKENGFVEGIDMIYKQLMGVMSELGVEEIKALGEEFNPNLHHAVTHEENEEYGENEVVEVFQKGYMIKESVLRYSMVKVAN
jgi:molecular chaperone GrpE